MRIPVRKEVVASIRTHTDVTMVRKQLRYRVRDRLPDTEAQMHKFPERPLEPTVQQQILEHVRYPIQTQLGKEGLL